MVDIRFPADVFENGVVARGIRNRQMQRSQTPNRRASDRNHREPTLPKKLPLPLRPPSQELSSIYCTHAAIVSPGTDRPISGIQTRPTTADWPPVLSHSCRRYCKSVAGSNTPYFEVKCTELFPVSPLPGHAPENPQVRVRSSFQSIDLAVITRTIKTVYTTRVQASAPDKAATDKISDKPNLSFIRSHISFLQSWLLYRKVEPKNASNSPINDYIRTAFPEICINMLNSQ